MIMGMAIRGDALVISPPFLRIIAEIDEFKGAWAGVGGLARGRLEALGRVAAIESIGSSTRIEGSQLSNSEVEELLAGMGMRRFETRDEQEVAGYAGVMEMVFAHAAAIELTENHIKHLHQSLLLHSSKDERHRGEYKTHPNSVSAFDEMGREVAVVFQTATPFDTPRLMTELVEWTNHALSAGEMHPLLVIAIFVVVFLEIHPFQDGNGRLSRILTTLLLLRAGYSYVAYSSLESIIEQSKQDYYLALRKTQGTIRTSAPDWQPWVEFFLRALLEQKRRLEGKIKRENLMVEELPALSLRILELVKHHGTLSNAQIVKMTGANRNTVKKHLASLTASGRLELRGERRGARYGIKPGYSAD